MREEGSQLDSLLGWNTGSRIEGIRLEAAVKIDDKFAWHDELT